MQPFLQFAFYAFGSVPFFVGFAREWTPMLRPRGYVFAIFVHAVMLAAALARHQPISVFLEDVVLICWLNLTLYGLARVITLAAQNRFWNWIDSLTPEQLLARILIIATLVLACSAPATASEKIKTAYKSAAQMLFLARQ
jgi:hypothetical protein